MAMDTAAGAALQAWWTAGPALQMRRLLRRRGFFTMVKRGGVFRLHHHVRVK